MGYVEQQLAHHDQQESAAHQRELAEEQLGIERYDEIATACTEAAETSRQSSLCSPYHVITLSSDAAAVLHELLDNPDDLTLNQAIDRVIAKSGERH